MHTELILLHCTDNGDVTDECGVPGLEFSLSTNRKSLFIVANKSQKIPHILYVSCLLI